MTILDIVIEGKDEASGAFKSVDSSLGKLAGTAGKAATVGLGLAAAGVAAVGAAAIGAGVAALNLSTDINNATNSIATKMGMSQDAAAGFEDVMKSIYANNFGESFDDIGDAIVIVKQNLEEVTGEELQSITEGAFALRDAFGVEVTESVQATRALMNKFGLDGEQAMNLVSSGMQNGLNTSGDFLESIGEYSPLFADAGFSAEQMYSIMMTGAETGVLGVDKIADAVKEMGIILNEGGDDTKAAFDKIGLSFDDIAGFVAGGDEAWSDYFDDIVGGLNDIDDPMERASAQTAIFGTMAEDLGVSFTEGLSAAGISLDDMAGSTEALNAQYDNWPSMFEGIKRNALLALEPLGDVLLDIGNRVMPIINDAFTWLQDNVAPIIQTIADVIDGFMSNLEEGMSPLDSFIEAIWDIAPQWLLDALITFRDDILPGLLTAFTLLGDYLLGVWTTVTEVFDAFLKLFDGDFEGFGEGLETAWTTLWDTVTNYLGGLWELVKPHLVTLLNSLVTWFNDQDWAKIGNDIIKFISDAFKGLWALIKPFLLTLWTDFSTWFNDQDWEQIGKDIVQSITDTLSTFWEFVKPHLLAFWVSFQAWFTGIDWGAVGETILSAIGAYIELHANIAKWILEKLTLMATAIFEWAKGVDWAAVATTMLTAIGDGITALSGFANQVGADIVAFIITGLDGFKTLVTTKLDEWIATFQTWAEDALTWENFGYLVGKAIVAGINFLKDLPAKMEEFWTNLTTWFNDQNFGEKGEEVSTGISEGLAQLWEDAKVKFGEMWTSIVAWFGEMDWKQLGIDVVQGIIDGINSMIQGAKDAIAGIGKGITKAFEEDKEIDSPSKEFFRFGEMIVLGLTKGIESSAQDPIDAMQELADKMTSEMISMVQSIIALVGPMLAALRLLSTFDIDSAKLIKTLNSFGDLVFHLGRIFAVAGWKLVIENRDMAKKMGEAMGPVVGAVVQAIEAFQLLGKAVFPTDLVGKITTLVDHIAYVAKQFAELAKGMTEELSNEMQNFNAAAASVMGLIGITIEAMTTLAAVDFGPIVQGMRLSEQIEIFKRIVRTTMLSFLEAAMLLDKEMSEQVGAFADAAVKVFGLVEIALSAIKLLADVDFGPIIGGLHLAGQIKIFRNIVRTVVREFADAAGEMTSELSEAIVGFIGAAAAVFALVEDAIIAVSLLSETDFKEIVDGLHLANQIRQFRGIIEIIVTEFSRAASKLDSELMAAVSEFAAAAGNVVAVIEPAVAAIASIGDFVKIDEIQTRLDEFFSDFLQMVVKVGRAIRYIGLALGFEDPDMQAALTSFTDGVNAIVGVIQPAVDALKSMTEYVKIGDLQDRLNEFFTDFLLMSVKVGRAIRYIGLALGLDNPDLQAALVSFAGGISSIIGVIEPATAALTNLVEYVKIEDLQAKLDSFFTDFAGMAITLVTKLNEIAALVTEADVTVAANFASSVNAIFNSVIDSFGSLNDLVNTNIPGGLQQILNDAIDILRASIPAAALAGYDFGMAWISGIREALGTLSLGVGNGGTQSLSFAGAAAGAGGAGGLTTNLNVGGLTFNTTISNQMDEDEFHFRVIETIRSLV